MDEYFELEGHEWVVVENAGNVVEGYVRLDGCPDELFEHLVEVVAEYAVNALEFFLPQRTFLLGRQLLQEHDQGDVVVVVNEVQVFVFFEHFVEFDEVVVLDGLEHFGDFAVVGYALFAEAFFDYFHEGIVCLLALAERVLSIVSMDHLHPVIYYIHYKHRPIRPNK